MVPLVTQDLTEHQDHRVQLDQRVRQVPQDPRVYLDLRVLWVSQDFLVIRVRQVLQDLRDH